MTSNIFITGVSGEVGSELAKQLSQIKGYKIFGLDINKPKKEIENYLTNFYKEPISNESVILEIIEKNKINTIYHLAAILSTSAEKDPYLAHTINVEGTFSLLRAANTVSISRKSRIKFFFPSSIAVYGLSSLKEKKLSGKINESKYLVPITMYGINKLYCEQLGTYFSENFQLLSNNNVSTIDFRCIRFPGLISAYTLPSGGTSDYIPEMVHAAVKSENYACFARADTEIPFMAMPDAVRAAIRIVEASGKNIKSRVYNIRGFTASAEDFRKELMKRFPKMKVTYKINQKRQKILDTWPMDVDDQKARSDWSWKSEFDFKDTLDKYLLPILSGKKINSRL